MRNHQASSKEEEEAPQAEDEDSNDRDDNDTAHNVVNNAVRYPAEEAARSMDQSYKEIKSLDTSTNDVGSRDGFRRTAVDNLSIKQEESTNSNTTILTHGPQIDLPTDLDQRKVDNGNGTASSSKPASSTSLIERASLNFAPPSGGAIPTQAGIGILPITIHPQSTQLSLSRPFQAQAPRTTQNSSFLNQLGSVPTLSSLAGLQLPHMSQAQTPVAPPPSNLQTSLLGQLQLASLAQYIAGLPQIHQAPAPSVASPHISMIGQLVAAQVNAAAQANQNQSQNSYLQPNPNQSTLPLANAYMLQRLSASQYPPFPPIVPQDQSQLLQSLIHENMIKDMIKDQIVSLLLSQQQAGLQNNCNTAMQTPTPTPTPTSQLQLHLQSIAPASNTGTSYQHQGESLVAALVYPQQQNQQQCQHQQQHQQPLNTSESVAAGAIPNSDLVSPVDAPASDLPASGHLHAPNQSKEKRWMMRYEELRSFQQKHGHCSVPHGYAENRKLSWWVMNQRAQFQLLRQGKKSWLTDERVALLDNLGFDWNPIIGKSCSR
mmetsp:Transcript_5937/g.12991  ORF Transcript_5937/g.12991 Transcript_5937/m.12991 type:complete len:544 (+) Transcript_5937:41-1672(+)